MSEFSRRLDIHVFKDEPLTPEEWTTIYHANADNNPAYQHYLDRFQPYRWQAKGMNGEILSNGERYFNEQDAWDNVELNFGDDTTIYAMPMYGEDRSERWMRYSATDRQSIDTSGGEDVQ